MVKTIHKLFNRYKLSYLENTFSFLNHNYNLLDKLVLLIFANAQVLQFLHIIFFWPNVFFFDILLETRIKIVRKNVSQSFKILSF